MKLLLDTHLFLFAIADPDKLSPRMRAWLQDPQVRRWVSVVSLWEIVVKVQIGKLNAPLDPAFYSTHLRALRAETLPVSVGHTMALMKLPLLHRDPFDRLLLAQAIAEGFTMASRDGALREYGLEVVW